MMEHEKMKKRRSAGLSCGASFSLLCGPTYVWNWFGWTLLRCNLVYCHVNYGTESCKCGDVCVCLFPGIMATATSQQPPKDDEEEEDEEQGEEFEFDDSTDEEKIQEDTKGMDSVLSTEQKSNEILIATEKAELLKSAPPAGQEANFTKLSLPSAGKTHFFFLTVIMFFIKC